MDFHRVHDVSLSLPGSVNGFGVRFKNTKLWFVPKNLGKHVQEKTNQTYYGGNLNLVHGSRQFMSNSQFKIVPEVGDFYFFPHYLMHTVYPFTGSDEERRSISFNANIDENIYNVYGQY